MRDESQAAPLGNKGALSEELKRALTAAQTEHSESQAALRAAVCAFIDDLRAQGSSLEQSTVEIRAFVARLRSPEPRARALVADDERALNRMIQWCTDHWASRRPGLPEIDRA